jgi:hypothetical protein
LPPVIHIAVPFIRLAVPEPVTVQTPVIVPDVDDEPVVTTVDVRVPIFAEVIVAFAMLALAEIVRKLRAAVFAANSFETVMLLDEIFPVTVTPPNEVVPPELVAASVSHAAALVVPSAGQTFMTTDAPLVSHQS